MIKSGVSAALRGMLGPAVGIGVTDPREVADDLWPEERGAIAAAIPKRQREFAAGRRAARQAMAALDLPAAAIPMGQQRAPIWPQGLAGSISHCDTLCVAIISQMHQSVGIDVEDSNPLDHDLVATICTPLEQRDMQTLSLAAQNIRAKQIFCAKEAIYKAQYPLTGQMLNFDAVEVRFIDDATFEAALPGPVKQMHGKIVNFESLLLATVMI